MFTLQLHIDVAKVLKKVSLPNIYISPSTTTMTTTMTTSTTVSNTISSDRTIKLRHDSFDTSIEASGRNLTARATERIQ